MDARPASLDRRRLVSLFMVLTAAQPAAYQQLRPHEFPEPELAGTPLPSLDPATNTAGPALASQIFVVAAVFAVASHHRA